MIDIRLPIAHKRTHPRLLVMVPVFAVLLSTLVLFGAAPAPAAQATAAAPVNVTAPQVLGEAVVGETLSATPGSWLVGDAATYSLQWWICRATCMSPAGVARSQLALESSHAGATIAVSVTARNLHGTTIAESAATATVTLRPSGDAPLAGPALSIAGGGPAALTAPAPVLAQDVAPVLPVNRHGNTELTLRCPATVAACSGTIFLSTTYHRSYGAGTYGLRRATHARTRRSFVIGALTFQMPGGTSGAVSIPLAPRTRNFLRSRQLSTMVRITTRDVAGHSSALRRRSVLSPVGSWANTAAARG